MDMAAVLADLHTHTTASDGQYTPAELVRLAKARGISVLAVTGHDTIAGVDEAQSKGDALGLRVVRGVELSAREHANFHILGYAFQAGDTELTRLCRKFQEGREERKYKIVDFLQEKGVKIDLSEVEELAGGEIIARPHFARILVRHGYAAAVREAFDRYFGYGGISAESEAVQGGRPHLCRGHPGGGRQGVLGSSPSNGTAGRRAGTAGGSAQGMGAGCH